MWMLSITIIMKLLITLTRLGSSLVFEIVLISIKTFRLMAYNTVLSIFLVMQLAKMSSDLKTWVSDKLMSLLGYSQPTVVQYVITLCKVFYT